MKKIFTFLVTFTVSTLIYAQLPQSFSYQAIVRGANNALLSNQKVGIKISLLKGTENGQSVYSEVHTATTNANGLVSIAVGGGNLLEGNFVKIDWANGPYFVKTEIDPEGGTNYSLVTTTQLLSVPYALYAANSQPGPKGDKGEKGDQGTPGTPGKDGMNGKDGLPGVKGNGFKEGSKKNQFLYWNGTDWITLNPGLNGQHLMLCDGELTWTTGIICPAKLSELNCEAAIKNGTIFAKYAESGINTIIPYSGGNEGSFKTQIILSTGVTGLTATLKEGLLENGNGKLNFEISGKPSESGTANFNINIGGKACSFSRTVLDKPISGNGPEVSDLEGNVYKTVYIGTQLWMAENLNVSKYNDGTKIPNHKNAGDWMNTKVGAWCYYGNDELKAKPNGKLYNWLVTNRLTNNDKNVCPVGWHVPSDGDWLILSDYLGGFQSAGEDLKESGTTNRVAPNTFATNKTLFSAVPSGYRAESGNNADFFQLGTNAYIWTSTEFNSDMGRARFIYENKDLLDDFGYKKYGFSIRCVKDSNFYVPVKPIIGSVDEVDCDNINIESVTLGKSVNFTFDINYINGNGGEFNRMINYSSIGDLTATIKGGVFNVGNGKVPLYIAGTPNFVGAGVFNIIIGGKTCNLEIIIKDTINQGVYQGNIQDVDGNIYKVVKIGNQIWMAENLKTTSYNNGDKITLITNQSDWNSLNSGARCSYNFLDKNNATYGQLYNWNTVSISDKNVCPVGWHVPTDAEWEILSDYLKGREQAGGSLKSAGYKYWSSPNLGATNTSLFTGLPGGYMGNDGNFYNLNNHAHWWSSTVNDYRTAFARNLNYSDYQLLRYFFMYGEEGRAGLSIRCIKSEK